MKKIRIVLCALVLLAGCSYMSVSHLPLNPLAPGESQSLALDFWDFQYVVQAKEAEYHISGKAFPNTRIWPGWAEWFQNLQISVFISDEAGRVLARDRVSYPVQRMAPEGLAFAFAIPREAISPGGDLSVTFGYRMTLTRTRFQAPPARGQSFSSDIDVFAAQRGPLPR